ncbi:heme ABC transporter ATP-binding protein [Sphingobacterium gobiense]|uniref:Heme ABC transporter ATP-binding protein n=1 Tax=Sphingobacterium gobiense TaxID=1382456 RepID=A0A2S9JR88_9SPHI|nr:heme ABC transporter ATP-binding protein [Sphingobacterium gobiense]PRD55807.1 heme ABC transporter ATP-binding protein [Sphingobacterium gobiense]
MLRVEKLNYEVKGRKLLKDISLQVRKGEIVVLLGSNGAGKSTLMRLLSGDRRPNSGIISLNGQSLMKLDPRALAKCRALLTQQQQVSLSFKVSEIVLMGRYPHFTSAPQMEDVAIVDEVMALCGITQFSDRIYMSLSGGEQQRVQLARVLVQVWDNPDSLLLLDEPISALDMHYQQKVLAIAKGLSRKGYMVVLIVHDLNFAANYADRIVMLKHGRKLFDGTPNEVLNTKNIYTVFSVEAQVDMNPKTLRPCIKLEEMLLEEWSTPHII